MRSRWEEFFGSNRKWRVAAEVDGVAGGWPTLRFDRGHFECLDGSVFISPMGPARGRNGTLLQEVDGRGRDVPGSLLPVGVTIMKRARKAGVLV